MKTEINKPWYSKINYTALAIKIVGIFAVLNLIPPEVEEQLVEVVMIAGPALIMVWRSFFTDNVQKPLPPAGEGQ